MIEDVIEVAKASTVNLNTEKEFDWGKLVKHYRNEIKHHWLMWITMS